MDVMADKRDAGAPPDEELLQLIFDSATDYAIFAMNPLGIVTSWNSGAQRLLGWTSDEIVGRTGDVIFTTEDRAAGTPEDERAQAAATGRAEDERWHQRRDGGRFWASGLAMPLRDPSGGFVKIMRDRTEKHRDDERLRYSEERFRLLATSIPQLVFGTRSNGVRTWPSPQWIEFTGLDTAASLGFGWLDAVHPDDREATVAAWRTSEQSGEHYSEQRVRRQSDGQWRWHQMRARPIRGDQPSDWVGTMTDVHDLRGLQDRQKVLMAELQHRTRNLLALVQAIAKRMLRTNPSPGDFERQFEARLSALGRVQVLISGVDYGDIDLRDLLTAELQAHEGLHVGSGHVVLDGPAAPLAPDVAQALGLALHELVTNAAKHGALATPDGRIAVTWEFEKTSSGNRLLRVVWKESGVTFAGPASARSGYGRELIEQALPYQFGAKTTLVFEPDGVRCTIEIGIKE